MQQQEPDSGDGRRELTSSKRRKKKAHRPFREFFSSGLKKIGDALASDKNKFVPLHSPFLFLCPLDLCKGSLQLSAMANQR